MVGCTNPDIRANAHRTVCGDWCIGSMATCKDKDIFTHSFLSLPWDLPWTLVWYLGCPLVGAYDSTRCSCLGVGYLGIVMPWSSWGGKGGCIRRHVLLSGVVI